VGKGAQAAQAAYEADQRVERTAYPDPRAHKPGRRPKSRPKRVDAADCFEGVLRHYFPGFLAWLKAIRDPRKRPDLCTYPIEYILMTVLMMHCGQCGSRRQLGRELAGGRLGGHIWRLVGKAYSDVFFHTDTMNAVMEVLDPAQLDGLIAAVFTRLRKMRVLDRFRFDGKPVVAVDGTKLFSFKTKHCEHCTHQTQNGVTTYFHYVLAAKVVTPIGLVIPLAFEFVENPSGEYDKQDCEKKAWRRLLPKIRALYPKLKIVLLGDGLYAEQPTFDACEEAGWDFMITLTDDDLPTLSNQLKSARFAWSDSRTMRLTKSNRPMAQKAKTRTARWKTPLRYHNEVIHVIEMEEHDHQNNRVYFNRWVTNVKPTRENALTLAQAGRLRWKIENEGTNTPKNGGYEQAHLYGRNGNAWKNYFLTLQISQLLCDLVRFSDYVQRISADPKATFAAIFETIGYYAQCLLERFKTRQPNRAPPPGRRRIQIRLTKL
jgi:hypothetical protein